MDERNREERVKWQDYSILQRRGIGDIVDI